MIWSLKEKWGGGLLNIQNLLSMIKVTSKWSLKGHFGQWIDTHWICWSRIKSVIGNWGIPLLGYSRKKNNQGCWSMESPGVWRNSKRNFQVLIKNKVEFSEVIKEVEIPGVLVLDLNISKGGVIIKFCGVSRGEKSS